MLRIVALALLLVSPGLSWSLEVGDITVRSALNEPLQAGIPLNSLRPGELDELVVRVADEAAFARVGLERSAAILSMSFAVVAGNSESEATVLVSSQQGMREPIMSFVLDFSGLDNRVLREYTILLDPASPRRQIEPAPTAALPPVAAPQPAAVSPAPVSSPALPPRASTPAPAPRRAETEVPVPAPQVLIGNQPVVTGDPKPVPVPKPVPGRVTYQDQPGDGNTLGPIPAGKTPWRLALEIRPDAKVTMDQVLWALFSANPDGFDGNLNALKEGAVLKIPSRQAMVNVSPAEASVLVAEEAAAYQGRPAAAAQAAPKPASQPVRPPAEPVRAQPVATPRVTPAPTPRATPAPTPRAVPTSAPTAAPAAVLPALPSEPELEPLPVDDDFDSNAEFSSDDFGASDEDADALRRLQQLAGNLDDDLAPEPAAPAAADPQALPALPELPTEPTQDAAPQASEPFATDEEPSGGSGLLIFILLLLIGGGIGGLLFWRRRQAAGGGDAPSRMSTATPAAAPAVDEARTQFEKGVTVADTQVTKLPPADESDDSMDDEGDAAVTEMAPVPREFVQTDVDNTSAFGETSRFQAGSQSAEDQAFAATVQAPAEELAGGMTEEFPDDGSETLDLGSETVSLELNEDPVSEADFHLAYGLYDEAALLLNQAIENDPERIELREKLAETYFAAGNSDQFQATAQGLKDRGAPDAVWQKVAIMGQQLCPDAALFQGEIGGDGDAVDFGFGDDGGGLDMDFAGDDSDAASVEASEEPATDAGAMLEFDLGDDDPPATESADDSTGDEPSEALAFELDDEPTGVPAAEESDSEFSLDDDMGDLEWDAAAGDDEELPEIDDDLDLGDLEAELELDDEPSPAAATATNSSDDELSLEDDAADDAFTLDDDGDAELSLEDTDQPAMQDEGLELELGSDEGLADDTELSLDDGAVTAQDGAPSSDWEDDPLAGLDVDNLEIEGLGSDMELGTEEADDLGADTTMGADDDFSELTAELPEEGLDTLDLGDDTGLLSDGDEAGTKLDLARAYVDMGEGEMARGLLEEVVGSGSDEQKNEAQELLSRLS